MPGNNSVVKQFVSGLTKIGTPECPLDVEAFDEEGFNRARARVESFVNGASDDEEEGENNSDSESLGSQDSIVVKSEEEDHEPWTPGAPPLEENWSSLSDMDEDVPKTPKKQGRAAVLSLEYFFIRNSVTDAQAKDMCNAHLSVIRGREGKGKAAKAAEKGQTATKKAKKN